jgi:regulatory protein
MPLSKAKSNLSCMQSAMNILARREHSRAELKQKLLERDFAAAEIDTVIENLASRNLQSDKRFTEAYVIMRTNRGYGPLRIEAELRERGIGQELAQKFIEPHADKWFELASKAHRKKFGTGKGRNSKDFAQQAKEMRYLQYKGFGTEQIRKAIKGNY